MQKKTVSINSWLNRPFPYVENQATKVGASFLFGSFIFLFLRFFQPFGIADISQNKTNYLSGFGLMTFIGMMINFFVLPLFFPSFFDTDKWCVKKHIVFCLGNILLIALLNWFYYNGAGPYAATNYDLISFLIFTVGVGIIPTIIATMYLERNLWKKHSLIAKNISDGLEKQKRGIENIEFISLISENINESFQLSQGSLICISSEGNYSKVYYQDKGKVAERLMRLPLKIAEEHLVNFDKIVRCHRSYIVNLKQVASVSGNARSYKLHMTELDFTIPVSRNLSKTIIEQLKTEQS